MTKEELVIEAEKHSKDYPFTICLPTKRIRKSGKQIAIENYLAGAEPREKRIEELEHQLIHRNCVDCSNHSSKLKMRTLELEHKLKQAKKLEIQIEKMKCCGNCNGVHEIGIKTENQIGIKTEKCKNCKNLSEWELRK